MKRFLTLAVLLSLGLHGSLSHAGNYSYSGISVLYAPCLFWSGNCPYYFPTNASTDACAPEVRENNLATTDQVLKGLSQNELKNATKFGDLINKISALPGTQKMGQYLGLAGVQTDEDIAQLVGARRQAMDPKFIKALSTHADLTPEQSKLVLERLSLSLLGEKK